MSFLRDTHALKKEVLNICGELDDGTSHFDSIVVDRLNALYQGLLAGGNEFGIDIAEPWVWAQSKRPILLTLLPNYNTTNAVMTQGSFNASFSAAPTISLEGYFLRLTNLDDIYRIAHHTASQTAFTLDQPYIQPSGTFGFEAFKLDYDLIDNTVIIDQYNDSIDFRENASVTLTAVLTHGSYTPTTLCAEIKSQMEIQGAETYTISFNSITRKFTIAQGGAYLDLRFASGPSVDISASEVLGYDMDDYTGALSYVSPYSLNAITRLTAPAAMYREAPAYYTSPKDAGKIFLIDNNTFLREYPLNRLRKDMPDRMCIVGQTPQGLWKVRFNQSPTESIRAEINYIPVRRKLVDNTSSYPVLPGANTDYLVFGAAHFVLLEKTDSKAEMYGQLAEAKLRALVNDNRKNLQLSGINYGKLIPRRGQTRIWGYNR